VERRRPPRARRTSRRPHVPASADLPFAEWLDGLGLAPATLDRCRKNVRLRIAPLSTVSEDRQVRSRRGSRVPSVLA
jgi:hypothetical protein